MRKKAIDQTIQSNLTPALVLERLKAGNENFVKNKLNHADFQALRMQTQEEQNPQAIVLSCIDSRVPVELVFDQTVGDIFVARVAGNFVNTDILGSMEYACKVAGSKLIVVMGHQGCGAVKAACDKVELGHITSMLGAIMPAVEATKADADAPHDSSNDQFVAQVTQKNVENTIAKILEQSPILRALKEAGDIDIVGGVYQLHSGEVEWL